MQRILINETRKVAGAVLGAAAIALLVSLPALAQYPNKPIHLITPYPPGGTTDILSRLVGQKMALGQPVLVEPKPGAGGNIGAEFVAKSPADGYTLLMGASGPLAINASLFKNLPYDPAKDFSPIVHVASVPLVLVVHPSFPAQNIKEFLALVKTKKDLSYASAGNGTPQHLSGELFRSLTGAQLLHVPYKGSGPAITDLLGNQVPMAFESMAAVLQYVKAGKLRALAVTSSKRSSNLPDVPTLSESGVKGYESIAWYGVVGPANVPKDIVTRLNVEMRKAMEQPDVKVKLHDLGSDPVHGSPEQFGAFIKAEIFKWSKVVKDSGATVD